MDARMSSYPTNKLLIVRLLALVLLSFLVLASLSSLSRAIPTIPPVEQQRAKIDIGSLPLSEHATRKHAGERWNAITIQSYMASGQCKPSWFDCHDDTYDAVCQIKPGLSIMLVVGKTYQQIITGYALSSNRAGAGCSAMP